MSYLAILERLIEALRGSTIDPLVDISCQLSSQQRQEIAQAYLNANGDTKMDHIPLVLQVSKRPKHFVPPYSCLSDAIWASFQGDVGTLLARWWAPEIFCRAALINHGIKRKNTIYVSGAIFATTEAEWPSLCSVWQRLYSSSLLETLRKFCAKPTLPNLLIIAWISYERKLSSSIDKDVLDFGIALGFVGQEGLHPEKLVRFFGQRVRHEWIDLQRKFKQKHSCSLDEALRRTLSASDYSIASLCGAALQSQHDLADKFISQLPKGLTGIDITYIIPALGGLPCKNIPSNRECVDSKLNQVRDPSLVSVATRLWATDVKE
ncbi:Alpha-16 giardin [Giardia muris]|uniref:Alpha-16 giardin n=1 Tax=Giardia muris TaxID=5742 RepID=A0A142C644_GIAMU|nr:alpha-16 giardin [Giardia muris]TNJ29461.1 Alpha-16 giardin [Giardia muris]|eukprot:TNJ29461.1 Alpha-16 giardin [Giardia muris]